MGGSWRGHGRLDDARGEATGLGTIGFPAGLFVPWLGGDRAVWMDRRGRPLLTSLDAPTKGLRLSDLKGQCYSIACRGDRGGAVRMFGWRKRALALFNRDGETTGEFTDNNLWLDFAFAPDGSSVVAVVAPGGGESPRLIRVDATTGTLVDDLAVDTITDLSKLARAGGTGWRTLTRADQSVAFGNEAGQPSLRSMTTCLRSTSASRCRPARRSSDSASRRSYPRRHGSESPSGHDHGPRVGDLDRPMRSTTRALQVLGHHGPC